MQDALPHNYPGWEYDCDSHEDRYVWPGHMRIVSAKRARELRKRGVPLMPLHAVVEVEVPGRYRLRAEPTTPGNGPGKRSARYAWFVADTNPTRETRRLLRQRRAEKARQWRDFYGCLMTPDEARVPFTALQRLENEAAPFMSRTPEQVLGDIECTLRIVTHMQPITKMQPFPVSPGNEQQYAGLLKLNSEVLAREMYEAMVGPRMAETILNPTPEEDTAARLYFAGIPHLDSVLNIEPSNAGVPTHYEACPKCNTALRTNLLGCAYCPTCGD